MEKILLNDWNLFSERHNSRNYVSKDHKWLLKTSSNNVSLTLSNLEEEVRLNNDAIALGIVTPVIKGIVEVEDEGLGIIYQYVDKKKVS